MKYVFLILFCCASFTAVHAQRTLTGKITDAESGEALIGVSVSVKNTSRGTVSDASGNYSVAVPNGATTLVFTYVGYATNEQAIGASNTLDVALRQSGLIASENVVVIGSRNATRTKLETPVPVDVIPVSAVANDVGQVDLNQILTYIAPSFQSARQAIADGTDHMDPAQLRGLGPDQVLVLINGKRRHQSALVNVNGTVNRGTVGTDMSAIPASSVDRIEILRDGAAAQYGSDAIAGVVNIVLKKSTGVLGGSLAYGAHATAYEKNYALNKTGGNAEASTNVADGGTLQAGLNYGFKIGKNGFLNLTGEYIKRGETNRTGTYTGQIYPKNGAGAIVDDSILNAKGLNRNFFDMRIGSSRMQGGGIMANLEAGISDDWTLYAFGGFNRKNGNGAGFYRYPNAIVASARQYAPDVLAVAPDGFLPEIVSDIQDISLSTGIRGIWRGWNVDLSNTFGENSFGFSVENSFNYTQASDTNLTELQRTFDAGGLSFLQNTTNLDFSKKYDAVLAGLNVAFGAEHRIDQFGIRAGEESSWRNFDTGSGAAAGAQVFAGFLPANEGRNDRNCVGLYLDLEQDITESLVLGGALRFENYSDFGSTINYKGVGRYKFGQWASLRASASTGFRAPSMQQRFYAKTNTLFVSTPQGLVPTETGTFPNDSRPAEILGIPELKEETSVNLAAGITARPIEGLEITVDAYQIDITDRIVLTNNFTDGGDSTIRAQLAAANAGQANFFSNAVDTRARGLETVLSYGKKFAGKHSLRLIVAATFIKNEVKKNADGSPKIKASDVLIRTGQVSRYFNREDQSRIEVANPRQKISATLNYKTGKFGAMLRAVNFGKVVYLDPTINPADPAKFPANAFNGGALETLDQTFSAKTVLDLSLSYDIAKGIGVTIGANNLLDTYPDIHTHSGNMSLGRFVYSRRVQQMGFNGRYVFGRLRFDIR